MAITISGSGITSANIADGTIVNADINSSAAIDGSKLTGAGKVLQVVSTTKTDVTSTTSTSFVDVTGLSVSITPSSTSSKILIIADVLMGASNIFSFARLVRDSTAIAVSTVPGTNRVEASGGFATYAAGTTYTTKQVGINHLDTPSSTSALTYKIQFQNRKTGGGTAYINSTSRDLDDAVGYDIRGVSSITVMEIGA